MSQKPFLNKLKMQTNEIKLAKDRRFTRPNTNIEEYGGLTNIEQMMSTRIQAAKASRVYLDQTTAGSSQNQYGGVLSQRTKSVFSHDGDIDHPRNKSVALIRKDAGRNKIAVNSQRFQTPQMNFGAPHTFSQNVLTMPETQKMPSKMGSMMLKKNKSVLERIDSQLLRQQSNAKVFSSPHLQKQRIIEITSKNSRIQLASYKQVDPLQLATRIKPSFLEMTDNHETDSHHSGNIVGQELIEKEKTAKKNLKKEMAIWQQIRDQDSQHQDVPFYMTEQHYTDWQVRARTPPSPTVSEKVRAELAQKALEAQMVKSGEEESTVISESDVSQVDKKNFSSLIKRQQKNKNHGQDLIEMIEAEHSENSLDEEEERKFAELKRIVNNPMQERQTQFDYQTKKNLDYFGVVLPGTQKEQQEYQRKYTDTLMHKYRVSMHRKKDFINQVKRNKGLTPLQKLQQTQANMLKHGITLKEIQPAELSRKVFERLKDREEDMVIEDRRKQTIEQLFLKQEELKGLQLTEMQMKESVIQEKKLFVTSFGKKLLSDLSHNPAMIPRSERRDGFLLNLRETTQKIMKNNKIIQRTSVREPANKYEESEEEEDQKKELFYESRLKQNFYNSLKQTVYPCQDEVVNQEFQSGCLIVNQVLGLPAMTKITQDGTLSLVGYKLNSGLCQNLGAFLAKHTTRQNPYLVRKLILDDNFMKDADFASLLTGISAQKRLESLSYSQNELGSLGLAQLRRLVDSQLEDRSSRRVSDEDATPLLSSLKFNCCKIKGECLNGVSKMIDEIQLQLRSLRLSDQRIGAAFPYTLEAIRCQQNLQYLNVSNSAIKPAQMVTLMNVLLEFKTLRTLILSGNPIPPQSPSKTPNKIHQEFMQVLQTFMLSQDHLTLLNISNMFLGFQSLLEFCHKAVTPTLQSLHLSGNDISDFQMQMLLSVMGVSMRKFEENREISTVEEIYVEVDNFGTAELIRKMEKQNFNPEKFINVQTIVNSVACKNQVLKHQEYKSNDGMGFGRIQMPTFDTNCTLNRRAKGDWQVVNNCFITNKHRYCVLFLAKSEHDHQQSFFSTISKTSEATYLMEEQIEAAGLQESKVPVLLGGLVLNRSEPMKEMISYWDELQSSLPHDYRLKIDSLGSYLRFKQEIVQKLEALGHMDPFLINAPSVQSEHNEEVLRDVLANYFVFAGYVPPGKHSVLIKTKNTNDSYLQKNIVIEPNALDYIGPFKLFPQRVDSFLRDWIYETHEERVQKLTFLMEHWTAKEILEDKINKQNIVKVLARNYDFLRSFQLELATRAEISFYPFIQLHKWAQLLQGGGVLMPKPAQMQNYDLSKINSSFNILLDQEILSQSTTMNNTQTKEFFCSLNEKCKIIHEFKQIQQTKEVDDADPDNQITAQSLQKQKKPTLATGERYSNSLQKFLIADTVGFIQNILKIVHLNNTNQGKHKDIVNAVNLQDAFDELANLRTQLNSETAPHLELSSLFQDKETLKIYSVNQPHIVNLFLKLTPAKRRFNYDSISKINIVGVNTATFQDCFFRAKMFSQEPMALHTEEHQFWLRELDFTEFQVFLALAAFYKTSKPTKAKPIVVELELAQKVQNLFGELFKEHLGLKMPVVAPSE